MFLKFFYTKIHARGVGTIPTLIDHNLSVNLF